jgi:uncharacterized protein YjaG (DUF416 family)
MNLQNETVIRAELTGLSKAKRGAFAMLCTEWLMPYFRECCYWQGDRNIERVDETLDRIWTAIAGITVLSKEEKMQIEQYLPSLFFSDPSGPQERTIVKANASSAVGAVCWAVETVLTGEIETAMKPASTVNLFLREFLISRDLKWNIPRFVMDREGMRETRERLEGDSIYRSFCQFQCESLRKLRDISDTPSQDECIRLRKEVQDQFIKLPEVLDLEPSVPYVSSRLDLDPYNEKFLLSFLENAHPINRALFAVSCTERLFSIYTEYCRTATECGEKEIKRTLDRIWEHLAGTHFSGNELRAANKVVDGLLQKANESSLVIAPFASLFLIALKNTIDVIVTHDVNSTISAGRATYGLIKRMLVSHYKIDTDDVNSWKRILRHPLYEWISEHPKTVKREGAGPGTKFFPR